MIARIWYSLTALENANKYKKLLKTEICPKIESKNVLALKKNSLFKRPLDNEIEFVTIMLFKDWETVRKLAGERYEKAYVPDKAREMFSGFAEITKHYEVIVEVLN